MQAKPNYRGEQPPYAGLWPRFLALAVDLLLFSAVFLPVTRAVKGVWIMGSQEHLWHAGLLVTDPLCIIFLLIIILYFVLLEGLSGATVGKRVLGLRVVAGEKRKPGLRRALIRNLLRVVDALPALNILGVALILSSRERARFGDRIAGTRVLLRD